MKTILILLGWIVLTSLILSAMYWLDKRAAGRDNRRIPEKTLLTWALIGGWPGAIVTGRMIRHKTQKMPYRAYFFLAAATNVIGIVSGWYFIFR